MDGARLTALKELAEDAACPEPVRYAYRAFDRRWVLADSRLGDFLRGPLWRAHGPRQVYLTTMLTNVLGPGPAAIATASVPDLDQFRGSFGARGVIPLWRDCAATRSNASMTWLRRLREVYGYEVTAIELMAYCYALLAGRGYTRQFDEELRTPGPRVPMTLDAALFRRGVSLGQTLLAVHTYRQVNSGCCRVNRAIGHQYPTRFAYANESLTIGDGEVGPIPREVWDYSVSGYRVLLSWVRRRVQPTSRGRSALDRVGPARWTGGLTSELLELIWLLERTLAMEPDLQALLQAVVSGGCVQALRT
jgi:predicted helicase